MVSRFGGFRKAFVSKSQIRASGQDALPQIMGIRRGWVTQPVGRGNLALTISCVKWVIFVGWVQPQRKPTQPQRVGSLVYCQYYHGVVDLPTVF